MVKQDAFLNTTGFLNTSCLQFNVALVKVSSRSGKKGSSSGFKMGLVAMQVMHSQTVHISKQKFKPLSPPSSCNRTTV